METGNLHVVSLGDLGAYGKTRPQPFSSAEAACLSQFVFKSSIHGHAVLFRDSCVFARFACRTKLSNPHPTLSLILTLNT